MGIIRNQSGIKQPEKFGMVGRFVRLPGQNPAAFPSSSPSDTLPHLSSTTLLFLFFPLQGHLLPSKGSSFCSVLSPTTASLCALPLGFGNIPVEVNSVNKCSKLPHFHTWGDLWPSRKLCSDIPHEKQGRAPLKDQAWCCRFAQMRIILVVPLPVLVCAHSSLLQTHSSTFRVRPAAGEAPVMLLLLPRTSHRKPLSQKTISYRHNSPIASCYRVITSKGWRGFQKVNSPLPGHGRITSTCVTPGRCLSLCLKAFSAGDAAGSPGSVLQCVTDLITRRF